MGDATYFIPQYLYVKALMVRTDILEKLGVTEMPKTTDEFLAVCKQITDPAKGQYAFALRGIGSPCKTTDIMFATEVSDLRLDNFYLTEDGTFFLDTDGGRKALKDYYELFTEACPPDSVICIATDFLSPHDYEGYEICDLNDEKEIFLR